MTSSWQANSRRFRTHLRDGCVDHAVQAILLCKTLGHLVRAVVQRDLLACKPAHKAAISVCQPHRRQRRASTGYYSNAYAPNNTTDLSRAISSSMPALMASRTVNCTPHETTPHSQRLNIAAFVGTQVSYGTAHTSAVAIVRLATVNTRKECAGLPARARIALAANIWAEVEFWGDSASSISRKRSGTEFACCCGCPLEAFRAFCCMLLFAMKEPMVKWKCPRELCQSENGDDADD